MIFTIFNEDFLVNCNFLHIFQNVIGCPKMSVVCSISDEVRIEELKTFSKSQNDYAQIKVCSSEIYEIGTNMINHSVSAE